LDPRRIGLSVMSQSKWAPGLMPVQGRDDAILPLSSLLDRPR
jgi:hypothetical protein